MKGLVRAVLLALAIGSFRLAQASENPAYQLQSIDAPDKNYVYTVTDITRKSKKLLMSPAPVLTSPDSLEDAVKYFYRLSGWQNGSQVFHGDGGKPVSFAAVVNELRIYPINSPDDKAKRLYAIEVVLGIEDAPPAFTVFTSSHAESTVYHVSVKLVFPCDIRLYESFNLKDIGSRWLDFWEENLGQLVTVKGLVQRVGESRLSVHKNIEDFRAIDNVSLDVLVVEADSK